MQIVMTALPGIPLVQKDDDLSLIILEGLKKANIVLKEGDVIVIAQKIVSKAEGRLVDLDSVIPSSRAAALALLLHKDPRLVELILSESIEVLKIREGSFRENKQGLLIVRHRLGYVLANAGVDMSNVNDEEGKEKALLLPIDADASCERIRNSLEKETGVFVGVIINDSHGRPFRVGTVGVALGVAGVPGIQSMIGKPDLFERELKTTIVGFADELSSGASLLMGQADEGRPIIHIRGLSHQNVSGSGQEIIREKKQDVFV